MIGLFSSKMYDKWDDFNYETVNISFSSLPIGRSLFVLREHVLMSSTTEAYI